jgi:hypothetical protein
MDVQKTMFRLGDPNIKPSYHSVYNTLGTFNSSQLQKAQTIDNKNYQSNFVIGINNKQQFTTEASSK